MRRLWLCPTRWIALARSRGVRGLYLPLWKIETTIRSRWTAEIARGPVPADAGTDAEPLRWEPMAGERVDHETLRCAALELDPDSTIRTSLRDGAGLVSWAPEYLSGWIAVVPAGSPRDAWQEERDGLLERSRERCAAELPVDRYRALQVETSVELAEVSSALAPVYVAAVPWRGKVYRFVVDGRTGRAGGHAPFSRGKLGALIGAGVLAVAAMGAALAHEEPPNRPVAAEPTRAR